jgi:hypothetical protein
MTPEKLKAIGMWLQRMKGQMAGAGGGPPVGGPLGTTVDQTTGLGPDGIPGATLHGPASLGMDGSNSGYVPPPYSPPNADGVTLADPYEDMRGLDQSTSLPMDAAGAAADGLEYGPGMGKYGTSKVSPDKEKAMLMAILKKQMGAGFMMPGGWGG